MSDKKNHGTSKFFIGWSDDIPTADRRFLLTAGLAAVGSSVFAGAKIAAAQGPVGTGSWDMGYQVDLHGRVYEDPYPILLTRDLGGNARCIPVVCANKCSVSSILGVFKDKPTVIRGSIIKRGSHVILAVPPDTDWINPSDRPIANLVPPMPEFLGAVVLNGEILDAKCWGGAMRPAQGKTHKSCASLCIRMGGTPWFVARNGKGQRVLYELAGANGEEVREAVLPLVADPVRVVGGLFRIGGRIQFRTSPGSIERL